MDNKKTTIIARDKVHLKQIIEEEIEQKGLQCDLNFIDTSKITDMSYLFSYSKFNRDISEWNTSKIKDMSFLFYKSKFNGDISKWDTSNVTNMSCIFLESIFNGDISQWNTCNVNDMRGLFAKSVFNGNISQWDTSNVTNMLVMFYNSQFTQPCKKPRPLGRGGCQPKKLGVCMIIITEKLFIEYTQSTNII